MLLNINATRAFILCFFTKLNQNEFRIATVAIFTCDLYAGSPPPHDLERLRTTMQRRVVDFVRVAGSTLAVFRYPEHPRFSDGIPDSP